MAKISKLLGTAEDTEAAFYDAISRADLDTLMSLWADEEDIYCIHPGASRLVGHAAIRASFSSIFEHGSIHIQPRRLRVIQNMMTSVHNVVEEISQANEQHQDIHILATNIYMKTAQGWRIVAHHASVGPGSLNSEQSSGTMLH